MALWYTFKPLEGWFPRPLTAGGDRDGSPFKKTWTQVQNDLYRELRMLGHRDGSVVLMTAHAPYAVRSDGQLRADAGKPEHPGVVLKFDVWDEFANRYVPMSFEADKFTAWQANVQAIAGAMEALRKVDRYGVSSRGKANAHYEGYKFLPSAEGKVADLDEALKFVADHSGYTASELRGSAEARTKAFRKAAKILHPDVGGDPLDFQKLNDARRLIESV